MHRLSLGTPGSKLHYDGGAEEEALMIEEQRRNTKEISSPSPSSVTIYFDEDDRKTAKRPRLSLSSDPPPEFSNYIHLIPLVIFFCLFCLFVFSHEPSQSDLALIKGIKPLREQLGSTAFTEDTGLYIQPRTDDGLTIQKSLRNLKSKSDIVENPPSPKYRRHRKLPISRLRSRFFLFP